MAGYRAILEGTAESVQDLELSAQRRLDEAAVLYVENRFHTAIYLAGLAAEMYLKTACFFLGGARPGDRVQAHLAAVRPRNYNPPFRADFEAGHGIWFWSQELLARRNNQRLRRVPGRYMQVVATLYTDWYIGMRYRPGAATNTEAARFITQVEWLANHHGQLRR
jgi:hypothetical protein